MKILHHGFVAARSLWVGACLLILLSAIRVEAQDVRERVVANHRLYLPAGAGPFPGIVAVPGCSGVSLQPPETDRGGGSPTDPFFRRHYPRVAARLSALGYAVMLVDYLTGENVVNACSGEIKPVTIGWYIEAAAAWLRNQPRVDGSRIHILAWSLGGAGLLHYFAQLPEADSRPPRSAIAVYPACGGVESWRVPVRVLFLLGDADDIAPPGAWMNGIDRAEHKELVTLRRYASARHGFDIDDAPPVVGTGRGTTIGFNAEAARASWEEILRFIGK